MQSVVSAAAQIILSVIPIVGIVMGSIVIFFFLLWNHKQRMLMIEKGTYQRKNFDLNTFSLLAGILLFGIGLALSVFFILRTGLNYELLGGIIPLAIGLGFLLFATIRKKNVPG